MPPALRTWLARYWPLLTVLALGLTISGWLGVTEHREGTRIDERRFELELRQAAAALEMNMERHEERLARFADHCAASNELPPAVWSFRQNRVIDLQGNLPAVMLAVYCPKVLAAEFQSHAERGRAVWAENYVFNPKSDGRLFALPAWQQWNRAGFRPIPRGTDLGQATETLPSLAPALAKINAWSDGQPSTLRRTDGQIAHGFWFGIPLFDADQAATKSRRPNETPEKFAERVRAHGISVSKGVLAVFLSIDRLVDNPYNAGEWSSRAHLRLYAAREPHPAALVNPATTPPPNPRHRRTLVVPWYAQRWSLEAVSTPLFEAESAGHRAWPLGLGGAGFTVLATTLIGVVIRARVRQERLTSEITEARNTLTATERERASLGDDLHDGAIQSLYAIQLGLTRTARDVADALPSSARVLDETRIRVDVVIAELRRLIHAAARRPADERLPLDHVLASVVQSLRATTLAELACEAEAGVAEHLTAAQSVALAQLARSALGNALRHAEASKISVGLTRETEEVVLVVHDNGTGFAVAEREGAGEGIRSMRRRASAAGGALAIVSAPGSGTRVEVRLRVPPEDNRRKT